MTSSENVEPEQVNFMSEGSRLAGHFYPAGLLTGKAVILCHDAFGHKGYWDAYARRLAASGFSVLSFDFAGHGESEGLRSQVEMPVWAYNVRDAMNFLGRKGYSKIGLVGSGNGGSAALLACGHDSRISCAVVMAAPVFVVPSLADQIVFTLASWIGPLVGKLRRRPFTLSRLGELEDLSVAVDEAACETYRQDPLVRQAFAAAPIPESLNAVWLDITTGLKKVTQPVLVLHGEKDKIIKLKQSQVLLDKLSGHKKLVLIPEAGHALQIDQACDEVFLHLVKWIKKYL
jgi:alpha-beta hydrolase superfamily lysophospholipase